MTTQPMRRDVRRQNAETAESVAESAAELAAAFVRLNDHVRTGADLAEVTQRLVELAVRVLPGCGWAAITRWPERKQPRSLATSDRIADTVDTLQYRIGEGPCLSAADDAGPVRIDDLREDPRWPLLAAAAVEATPVRAVMSFQIADPPDRAALNLYSPDAAGFDDDGCTTAALMAAHARVLLAHAHSADRVVNLDRALETGRQIGIAVGILMATHRVTEGQAFDMLRQASQRLNRKLNSVADDVARTGAVPD